MGMMLIDGDRCVGRVEVFAGDTSLEMELKPFERVLKSLVENFEDRIPAEVRGYLEDVQDSLLEMMDKLSCYQRYQMQICLGLRKWCELVMHILDHHHTKSSSHAWAGKAGPHLVVLTTKGRLYI